MKLPLYQKAVLFLAFVAGAFFLPARSAFADNAHEIESASRDALERLYESNENLRTLGHHALAVVIFPKVVKGGFGVGGQHGEGALFVGHSMLGYYRTGGAALGFGVNKFGYALFLMDMRAMDQLHRRGDWELDTVSGLVVLNKRSAATVHPARLTGRICAVFFDKKGVIDGPGLRGTEIRAIHPD
jgi:lipid-binding SYLF domain-containing protein